MSMDWVQKTYGVPARRGGRVEYTGGAAPQLGTIKSASGGRLNIQLDGAKHAMPFHPTWELRYLDAPTESNGPARTGRSSGKRAGRATTIRAAAGVGYMRRG